MLTIPEQKPAKNAVQKIISTEEAKTVRSQLEENGMETTEEQCGGYGEGKLSDRQKRENTYYIIAGVLKPGISKFKNFKVSLKKNSL